MTAYETWPSFIEIGYTGAFADHVATLCTRAWNSLGGTRGAGGYTAWDGSNRDALDMIEDVTADMALLLPATAVITSWVIFNWLSTTGPIVPVAAGSLNVAGADASPGWYEASQMTFSFYDSMFKPCKLVLLDAATNNNFSKIAAGSLSSDQSQLPGGFIADVNAWASRAGNQPKTIRNLTQTLNRRLRKKYGAS
jgi:hypothetical protein